MNLMAQPSAVGADAFDPYTALVGRFSIDPASQTSTFGDVFTIASKALELPSEPAQYGGMRADDARRTS